MIGHPADRRERAFGVSVGTVLLVIAAYQMWRGRITVAAIVAVAGGALVLLGLTWPAVLRRPSDAWWRLSHVLAYVNTRVLLTVIFLVLLVPIGLIWRVIGRDPLGRRRASAGWAPYPARYRDREHYRRMY
jgi:Saxitoxin biosynthesis operon protein SxtJ